MLAAGYIWAMKFKNFWTPIQVIMIVVITGVWKRSGSIASSAGDNSFRNTCHLILTRHARCRMDCRHINVEEIKEIVQTGTVNTAKSGPAEKGDQTRPTHWKGMVMNASI